jgi:hypothetical protein
MPTPPPSAPTTATTHAMVKLTASKYLEFLTR